MKYPFKSLVVAIFFALIFSAIFVSPAFADEGDGAAPVEPPALTESEEPGDDSAPADEAPPADETAPVEEAAPADDSAPADETAPVEESAPADEAAPAEEDAGEEVSEEPEAAEAEAAGDEPSAPVLADPIWCPSSVSMPVSGGSGCTASYSSLADLITYLSANQPSVAGTIWIEKTYASNVNDAGETVFTLDGATLTTMANAALTIKGGWNGIGTNTIDASSPSVFNGASLHISNWNNTITISDLEFNSSTVGTALVVESTKTITLLRVTTNSTNGTGALLSNTAGTGDVSVTNSQFNNSSTGHGVVILSNGAITLNGVQAFDNNVYGAYIDNSGAPSAKPVTITSGVNEFSDNSAGGLVVVSKGLISIKDLTATGNGGDGANLDNTSSTTAQGIVLSGTNVFGDNGGDGLEALSKGPITANNLIANMNGGNGVLLDNQSAATAQPVKVTGTNEFKYNDDIGLVINTLGLVTLNNLDANENGDSGAEIANQSSPTNQAVTMTGVNNFISNGDYGLSVSSAGVVTLNTVTAWHNSFVGVFVDNTYSAAARAVVVNGKLDTYNNGSIGVEIQSHGAITLTNVTANSNGSDGVQLYNDLAPTAQAITFKGPVFASDNGGNGLYIFSKGVISLGNVTANDNSGGGAELDNSAGLAAVTLSGTNSFSSNGASAGLLVNSNSTITVSNVTAYDNNGSGALLTNFAGLADISVLGVNIFSGNNGYGLLMDGRKNMTVQNVIADDNSATGLYIYNDRVGSIGKVTVAATIKNGTNDFYGNSGSGVEIYSLGAVSLASVNAQGNLIYGLLIVNSTAASPQAVTLTGVSDFSSNGQTGLLIASKGAVTLNNVEANANGDFGVNINNSYSGAAAPQNVTVNGYLRGSDNYYNGVVVYTFGAITITNLEANFNGLGEPDDNNKFGYGALLQNHDGTLPRAVTLKGTQYFDGNWTGGLRIDSLGVISVNSLLVYNNNGNGATLRNHHGLVASAVTLTGSSEFAGNAGDGLDIHSRGAVTTNNLMVGLNDDHGIYIDNRYGGTAVPQNVTMNGYVESYNNFYSGVEVHSHGSITLTNVWTAENGWGEPDDNDKYGYGVLLNNNYGAAPRAVVIKAVAPKKQPLPDNVFAANWSGGLYIESRGAITAANLYVIENEMFGVLLNNNFAGAVGGVTLTGYVDIFSTFNGPGLEVYSRGLIALTNADITNNDDNGALLNNTSGTLGVTLSGTNIFEDNGGRGLSIYTLGAIVVNNLQAWGNDGIGAALFNVGGTTAANVTLTGAAEFIYNNGIGLDITSSRTITINATLLAAVNNGPGVYLDNTHLGDAQPYNISLNGASNEFYGNSGDGLELYSNGIVTAKNLVAESNSNYGVRIENDNAVAPKAVTLVGPAKVNLNGWNGLHIISHGAVKLQDVTATNNGASGVLINNQNTGAVGGVTIGGTNTFTGNSLSGLVVASHGAVTANNLRAETNGAFGVAIYSESLNTVAVPVKITGINVFNYNARTGLIVESDSAITANNITAIGNGIDANEGGVVLDNYWLWSAGSVIAEPTITLTGITLLKDNYGAGMYFNSFGAVTLSRVIADANTGHGLEGETDKTITITCGSMTANGGNGWRLRSWLGQTVTLKGVFAIGNAGGNTNLLGGTLVNIRSC